MSNYRLSLKVQYSELPLKQEYLKHSLDKLGNLKITVCYAKKIFEVAIIRIALDVVPKLGHMVHFDLMYSVKRGYKLYLKRYRHETCTS